MPGGLSSVGMNMGVPSPSKGPAGRGEMPYSGAPTLKEYTAFHGMFIGPASAQRCIDSFTGKILFMPSCYSPSDDFPPPKSDYFSPWEVESLDLRKYYLLVLASLTGLSTLIGLTRCVDSREDDNLASEGPSLTSRVHPSLAVDDAILRYLVQEDQGATVRLVRRFEYNFMLPMRSLPLLMLPRRLRAWQTPLSSLSAI